jgi:hypothetical protein
MEISSLKDQFINDGSTKFYNKLLYLGLQKVVLISNNSLKGAYPHLEYLSFYDKLYLLYKQNGEEIYLDMAKVFRKASNKMYRILLKKNFVEKNNKFFNII